MFEEFQPLEVGTRHTTRVASVRAFGGPVIVAAPHRAKFRLRAARAVATVFRFATLRLAQTPVEPQAECILTRPFFGSRLALDVSRSTTHRLLYIEGERTVSERHLLRRLLRPGMRIVDVGANIGYYALFCADRSGRVSEYIAIEPSPDNLSELHRNVQLNAMNHVRIVPCALGDRTGSAGFDEGINGGIRTDKIAGPRVEVKCLDDIITGPIDFLKIDVEGYEARVLDGALRVVQESRPVLFVEVHPHLLPQYGDSPASVYERIRELYPRVRIFHVERPASPLRRVVRRYTGRDEVSEVADVGAYVSYHTARSSPRTFWMVGTSS